MDSLNAFLRVEEAGPRAVLLPANLLYNRAALEMLAALPKNVAAVLIAWEETPEAGVPSAYSPELKEPNVNASLAGSGVPGGWNGLGLELVKHYFPFNIFVLPPSVVDVIRLRTRRFRGGTSSSGGGGGDGGGLGAPDTTAVSSTLEDQFPRFVVQSEGKMWACNQTVITCLKDHTCLPVGGQSVWAAATKLVVRPPTPVEYVAVAAPMDSTALFHSRAVGAASEVSAVVTMLAVAEAFGAYAAANPNRTLTRVPVYLALNAEAYGYAGSRRFLNDVTKFECKDPEDAASSTEDGCRNPYMSSLKFLAFRRPSDGTEEGRNGTRFTHVLDVGPVGSAAIRREDVTLVPVNASATPQSTPRPATAADLLELPFFAHAARNSTGLRSLLVAAVNSVTARPTGFAASANLVSDSSTEWPIYPPTSGQSFITEASTSVGPPQVVTLVDYDDQFRDPFYHSELSALPADPTPLVAAVALAARGVVRTLVALAYFGADTTDGAVTNGLAGTDYEEVAAAAAAEVQTGSIRELLTCLTSNWTMCELASELLGEDTRDSLVRLVSPSNYASTYVPPTRTSQLTPSGHSKVELLRAFLASATAYAGREGDPIRCTDSSQCKDKLEGADEEALYCVRGRCLAADVYRHNAYGHGLESINSAQSSFVLRDSNSSVGDGAWTESYWDNTLGVCGSTEDAFVLSIGIMFAGLGVLVGAVAASAVVAWALTEGKGTSVVRGAEAEAV